MKDFGPKRLSRILFVMYYCVDAKKTRRQLQTLYLKLLSKLPEVALKAHDQSIVAFYHEHPCCKYFKHSYLTFRKSTKFKF